MIGRRKTVWLTVLMLLPWTASPAMPLQDFSSEIRAASAKLLDSPGRHADSLAALQALVDVLARMAQADTRVSEPARARLREASDAFHAEASLDGRGVRLLHDAWKSISGGSAFVFPAGVKDIPTASAQIKIRLNACLTSLASGNGDRAVRELLEAVLMIVTPMEARDFHEIHLIRAFWMRVFVAVAIVSPLPKCT